MMTCFGADYPLLINFVPPMFLKTHKKRCSLLTYNKMNQNLVLEEFEEIISEHSLRHFRGWFSSEETRN